VRFGQEINRLDKYCPEAPGPIFGLDAVIPEGCGASKPSFMDAHHLARTSDAQLRVGKTVNKLPDDGQISSGIQK